MQVALNEIWMVSSAQKSGAFGEYSSTVLKETAVTTFKATDNRGE